MGLVGNQRYLGVLTKRFSPAGSFSGAEIKHGLGCAVGGYVIDYAHFGGIPEPCHRGRIGCGPRKSLIIVHFDTLNASAADDNGRRPVWRRDRRTCAGCRIAMHHHLSSAFAAMVHDHSNVSGRAARTPPQRTPGKVRARVRAMPSSHRRSTRRARTDQSERHKCR